MSLLDSNILQQDKFNGAETITCHMALSADQ